MTHVPTRAQLAQMDLRYVVFDPSRCTQGVPEKACDEAVRDALSEVLGAPSTEPSGLVWWDLQGPRGGGLLDDDAQGSEPPDPEPSKDHQ